MTQAVIIHTIQDADHFLQQQLFKDAELFSFNVQIVTYLKHRHNVICHDLCSYISSEEVLDIQKTTLQETSELLAELDSEVAPALNREIGLSIRYFTPLYSYVGARQLSIYDMAVRCLQRMIDQYSPSFILVYEGTLGPLNQNINISFLDKMLPGVKFRTIQYKQAAESRKKTVISGISIEKIAPLLEKDAIINTKSDKKNLVVFESAGKLQFLLQQSPDKANIHELNYRKPLYYPIEYKISGRILPLENNLQSIRTADKDRQNILMLLYAIISDNFCRDIIQHLRLVQTYRNIHNQSPIHNAYWDIPPYQGAGALVLEYLMSNLVTQVIGAQSQGTFFAGQTSSPYVDVAIKSRCHRWLPQIVRSVSTVAPKALAKNASVKIAADVAIYLTPTSFFTKGGQNLSALVSRQEALLSFLETHHTKVVHVVASNHLTFKNCAMLSFLKTLTNVTLIQDAKMDNYLTKYAPKLILFDSPMPFLEDVLPEELSVILMKDPMITFSDEAITLLMERVYYAGEVEEAKQFLQKHFKGNLAKKQDGAYVHKFCSQAVLQEKILQEISS